MAVNCNLRGGSIYNSTTHTSDTTAHCSTHAACGEKPSFYFNLVNCPMAHNTCQLESRVSECGRVQSQHNDQASQRGQRATLISCGVCMWCVCACACTHACVFTCVHVCVHGLATGGHWGLTYTCTLFSYSLAPSKPSFSQAKLQSPPHSAKVKHPLQWAHCLLNPLSFAAFSY